MFSLQKGFDITFLIAGNDLTTDTFQSMVKVYETKHARGVSEYLGDSCERKLTHLQYVVL